MLVFLRRWRGEWCSSLAYTSVYIFVSSFIVILESISYVVFLPYEVFYRKFLLIQVQPHSFELFLIENRYVKGMWSLWTKKYLQHKKAENTICKQFLDKLYMDWNDLFPNEWLLILALLWTYYFVKVTEAYATGSCGPLLSWDSFAPHAWFPKIWIRNVLVSLILL